MNIKQIGTWVGIVVVLVVIAFGFSLLTNKTRVPVTPLTEAVASTSPILGGVATSSNAYEYAEDMQYYTVDVVYPSHLPLSADASKKAELTMEQALSDDIVQFKKDGDFANLTPADAQTQGLDGTTKYAYGATYQQYQSSSTVSYVFLVYEDTLGAHPNSFYQTFTFDLQGNQLQLADLFKPNTSYLTVLSPLAYQNVVAQLTQREGSAPAGDELDTVRMGTEPSPEALQFYYIDGNTLHLLFPPYQVAAYAAGAFDVSIPMSQLSSILK
jgi:Protein of unknown function (DUF3298)